MADFSLDTKTIATIVGVVAAVLGGNLGLEKFAGGSATVTDPNRNLTPKMRRTMCRMMYMDQIDQRLRCLDKFGEDVIGPARSRGE